MINLNWNHSADDYLNSCSFVHHGTSDDTRALAVAVRTMRSDVRPCGHSLDIFYPMLYRADLPR
jgi:hypothetical protein